MVPNVSVTGADVPERILLTTASITSNIGLFAFARVRFRTIDTRIMFGKKRAQAAV